MLCVMHSPVTRAGDQHAEQVVDDEGEDDGGDGSARDGVAGILQLTWETERVTRRIWHARAHAATHAKKHAPDMLEPAMIPVQPLNITAKTVAKVIIFPVV